MLFKKDFAEHTVNGVRMGNGSVAFQDVKMNVHSFFIDGVLIDTGAKSLETYFQPFFNKLNIEKVVLTHHHEDHTGGAAYLQNQFQLPIYMNNIKIEECKRNADYPFYRKVYWGKRQPFRAEPIEETFQSANAAWKVIHTPGHAIDHVCLLNEATGQLFTGDLYCQVRTKVVLRDESIPDIIDSLKKVLVLDFGDVFCCHAGFLRNGREDLLKKLDYLENLQGTVLKLFGEGKSLKEINKQLFPNRYAIHYFSGGEWDSIHMVRSIINEHTKISV